MATQHKVVFNFRPAVNQVATANSVHGWTETFYRVNNETDEASMTAARALLRSRLLVLTRGWRCNKIRSYVWPNSRQSLPFTPLESDQYGEYNIGGDWGDGAAKDEQPYDVLVQNIACAAGRVRAWGMRGIGSTVVDAGATYVGNADFVAANTLLGISLATGGWAIRVQTAGPLNSIYQVLIAGVADGLTGTPYSPVIGVTGTPDALVAGTRIRISGVLGFSGLNGVWTVQTAHAPLIVGGSQTVQLRAKRGRQLLGSYVGAGTVTALTYDLSAITVMTPSQGSSHRVGGLPGRLRGRRRRPV